MSKDNQNKETQHQDAQHKDAQEMKPDDLGIKPNGINPEGQETMPDGLNPDDLGIKPDNLNPDDLGMEAEDLLLSWPEKYAALEAKYNDLNDQFLRKAADFDNYRKRMGRERQELVEFANQSLLSDLLPVIDDFERAIKSTESSKDFNSFYEGIGMIEKVLISQLESKWGLKRFDSEGEVFDPNRHEAVQMEKSPDITEARVKAEFQKGYTLRDRVIRYAKVMVQVPEE